MAKEGSLLDRAVNLVNSGPNTEAKKKWQRLRDEIDSGVYDQEERPDSCKKLTDAALQSQIDFNLGLLDKKLAGNLDYSRIINNLRDSYLELHRRQRLLVRGPASAPPGTGALTQPDQHLQQTTTYDGEAWLNQVCHGGLLHRCTAPPFPSSLSSAPVLTSSSPYCFRRLSSTSRRQGMNSGMLPLLVALRAWAALSQRRYNTGLASGARLPAASHNVAFAADPLCQCRVQGNGRAFQGKRLAQQQQQQVNGKRPLPMAPTQPQRPTPGTLILITASHVCSPSNAHNYTSAWEAHSPRLAIVAMHGQEGTRLPHLAGHAVQPRCTVILVAHGAGTCMQRCRSLL